MEEHKGALEEKLQLIKDSFGAGKCQSINSFTCDLLVQAIDTKIKECVLSHDFRLKNRRQEPDQSQETAKGKIHLYEELKKQIQALPQCES